MMQITNKNSAYIFCNAHSKANKKISSTWRWRNQQSDYSNIVRDPNGNTREFTRYMAEQFCFNITLDTHREIHYFYLNQNFSGNTYENIQEKEIDLKEITSKISENVQIFIYSKSETPEIFNKLSIRYRNNDHKDDIKYILLFKPYDLKEEGVYSGLSPKAWQKFSNFSQKKVKLPKSEKSYLDFFNYFSPITEGRSPIPSTRYVSVEYSSSLGDILFVNKLSEALTLQSLLDDIDEIPAIKFKSILRGSQPSTGTLVKSTQNHLSGYTLIPYESETKNYYYSKKENKIKSLIVKGFICSIDPNTITKYKKCRNTLHKFFKELSMFDGESLFDYSEFENLNKQIAKGHNVYSNHLLEIFSLSSFNEPVKYSPYTKANLDKVNLSSLSRLHGCKKYKDLKSITETLTDIENKIENLNAQISNHDHLINRTRRNIEDKKYEIQRYESYIKNSREQIANYEKSIAESDSNLEKNKKQLAQNTTVFKNLKPQKDLILKQYKESLDEISSETQTEDKFLKSLNNQGIYILDIVYKNKNDNNDLVSIKQDENLMFNVKKNAMINSNDYILHNISFKVTKPIVVRVDPIEKGENCPKIAIGPLLVNLSVNNISLSPLTSNCILGVNKDSNTFWLHPHTSSFSLPTNNLKVFINRLMSTTVSGCLGEASSAIYNAFNNQDPRQAIFAAMTWLTSANSSDAWGKYWKNFPKIEEINSIETEISKEDYNKQLFQSSINDSELMLQNFFDNVTEDDFSETEVEWEDLIELPQENETNEENQELSQENQNNQTLRAAGVQGYTPLYTYNN